jgi:hypothetical protein
MPAQTQGNATALPSFFHEHRSPNGELPALEKLGCPLGSYRRFPNLPYRRFPNRQAVQKPGASGWRMVGGLGNPRYSRLGSLRYAGKARPRPPPTSAAHEQAALPSFFQKHRPPTRRMPASEQYRMALAVPSRVGGRATFHVWPRDTPLAARSNPA